MNKHKYQNIQNQNKLNNSIKKGLTRHKHKTTRKGYNGKYKNEKSIK